MPEIGTSSSMSGDGKRSVGHRPQTTAPVLDSTDAAEVWCRSKSAAISGVNRPWLAGPPNFGE